MFRCTKHLLLTALFILGALPVIGADETPGVAPVAAPAAVVKCHGVAAVPFTADAEQALPLRLVGSLRCGETVSVLSDTGGYTVHVRNPEGQEGYVVRMYLAIESESSAPAPAVQRTTATPTNGVVRWVPGAPGCDEFLSQGRYVESVTANGITVQASLQDSGWKYRANVAISNQSSQSVKVLPGIITLDELRPNLKPLLATNPAKVAHSPTHQVLWTAANAVPPSSVSVSRSTRTTQADPLAYRTASAPDYFNPHLTLASARPSGFSRTEGVDIQAISLKPVTLDGGQTTAGVMWYDRDSGARDFSMRVPVGDLVFDFSFSLEQKK